MVLLSDGDPDCGADSDGGGGTSCGDLGGGNGVIIGGSLVIVGDGAGEDGGSNGKKVSIFRGWQDEKGITEMRI